MNISNMKVAVRPMNTAQAVDLGMMMARHWFFPLWKIWMTMALPVFILINLAMITLASYSESWLVGLSGLLFWWGKPIYEKPMVWWLGHALFGEEPTLKQAIKQGWSSTKQYNFKLLLRHRFLLQRQILLPILILEKPETNQYKNRLYTLSRGQNSSLRYFTMILITFETVFTLGMLLLLSQLVPTTLMRAETLFYYIDHSPIWFKFLWSTFYLLGMSLAAPFFVSGGFAVYLTKRCLLEGWDIELVFKQLYRRYETQQSDPLLSKAGLVSRDGQP